MRNKPKEQFAHGSSTIEDFYAFINERQMIWYKRNEGQPWPWTEDEVLREYKFTNIFRELDAGTLFLRKRVTDEMSSADVVLNTIVYRMINREATFEACPNWPFETSGSGYETFCLEIRAWRDAGNTVFTGAHMTVGKAGADKLETVLETIDAIEADLPEFTEALMECPSLEQAFRELLAWKFYGIGKFIAYEIISDLRWTTVLLNINDTESWANIGPGCRRGLQRLGLQIEIESLRMLWSVRYEHAQSHVLEGPKPFELREIEHSLCEFDKYNRGKTRSRFVPPEER